MAAPQSAQWAGTTGWIPRALATLRRPIYRKSLAELDAELFRLLSRPPADDERVVALLARADAAAARLMRARAAGGEAASWWPPELDLACSGAGFHAVYFVGVHMLLTALIRAGAPLALRRYAGASSGAKAAVVLNLAPSEAHAVAHYLAMADLHAANGGIGPATVDHQQRWLADWIARTWGAADAPAASPESGAPGPAPESGAPGPAHGADKASDGSGEEGEDAALARALDGRVFVAVTTPFARPRGRLIARLGTRRAVREAFTATGTFLEQCEGRWCVDGGVAMPCNAFVDFDAHLAASAARAEPQAQPPPPPARAQLVCNLLKAPGFHLALAYHLEPSFAVETMARGIDDAALVFGARSPDAANAAVDALTLFNDAWPWTGAVAA